MKEQSNLLDRTDGIFENLFFRLAVGFAGAVARLCRITASILCAFLIMMTAFAVEAFAAKNVATRNHEGRRIAGAVSSGAAGHARLRGMENSTSILPATNASRLKAAVDRGPALSNSISWSQSNGPLGGIVHALVVNSSGYVFAGTYGGGVFRSTDNGSSWTQSGLTSKYVYSLATNSAGYVFAGTETDGVYRSTDNGNSWTQVGLSTSEIWSLAVTSSGYIFAGTWGQGIYLSTNNGSSWTQVGLSGGYVYSLTINSSGYIYAGTYDGSIYRSTDNGSTWTQVGSLGNEVLSLTVNSSGYIFAATYGGGVFRSTNNGSSWTAVNTGLTNSYAQSLAVSPLGYIFVATNGGAVYFSTSNGSSWSQVNNGLTNDDVWSLAINSSGYIFAGTWGQGIYLSTNNGSSWSQTNTGFVASEIWTLAVNSSNYVFAGAIGGGVYRSTDGGNNWTQTGLIESYVESFAINSSGYIFASTSGDGVYLSKNNGISWTAVNTGLTNDYVHSLAINASGYIIAGTDTGIYVSQNSGENWTLVALVNVNIQSLLVGPSGYIFAGGAGGAVYRSNDGGFTWSQVGSLTSDVYSLSSNSTGYIFAGTWGSGVYVSTNNGSSWSPANNGLANSHVQGIAINSSGYIFAGTWLGGVYESTDNAASWTQVGLSSNDIQSLVLNSSDYLFAGSIGGGVYETSGSTVVTPISGGAWTTKASVQLARYESASEVIDGILYVAGGNNGTQDDPSLQAYTIATNSWATLASMPGGRYQGDGAGVINGKLYVTGGWTTSPGLPNNNLWVYDPSTNGWSTLANAPTLSGTGTSGVINGKLYVTTSCDGNSGYRNYLWVYDPGTNSWTSLAGSPDAHGGAAYGVINGKFYVAGGVNSGGATFGELDAYDPSTNIWTALAPMPVSRSFAFSGVINGKLYVAGGSDGSSVVATVEVYDPATNTWSTDTPMTAAREAGASAVYNGTLYAVGGSTVSGGPVTTVEAFTPAGATVGPPTISSFSPTSGPIGTTVTITGTNFDPTASNNIVYFGAVKATVTAATSTSLSVTVPTGVTYQPITVTVNGLTAYSNAPFIVTFPSSQIIDATAFAATVDFTTGTNPYGVVIGDIDGDGKPDLVVTNRFSNTISVFRNTSASGSITAGSFAAKVDFTTGTNPFGISIGDIDGDGKPDLVVTNSTDNTISVYRNTSTPGSITASSFAAKVDFTTGTNPFGVVIWDIDGDGKPDLVVTNDYSNTVSVFRNISTPGSITASSFASKVDFPTGSEDNNFAICDVDGDGKPDLVVANWSSNTISVLRNTSTPGSITASSFAGKVDFTTGSNPQGSIAIGDIDGDGKPDLAVTNVYSNSVSVFRNTSTSGSITTSSFAPRVDFTFGSQPRGVVIGDIDGDGKPDLAVAVGASNSISVFRNTSTSGSITSGSFATKVDFTTGTDPEGIGICDIDGDGKPDLVVLNYGSNTVSVFRNTISGSLSAPILASPANGSIGISTSPTLTWNASTGATSYELQVSTTSTFATTVFDQSNLTSTSQSLSGLSGSTTYYWRVNASNGTGTSGWSAVWSFTTIAAPSAGPPTISSFSPTSGPIGTTVKINGANFSSTPSNNIVFFGATKATVTGASTAQLTVTVPAGATYQPITITVGGLTAYSSRPFIVTFPTVASITSGSLASKVDFATGTYPFGVAIGDIDGDGKPDVVVCNCNDMSGTTVSVFRNTSSSGSITSGSLAAKLDLTTGVSPRGLAIGDIDGDGRPDLVVGNYVSSTASVFRNTSTSGSITSGSFASKIDLATGAMPNYVAIGDIDGDGRPDVVTTNYYSNTITVLRNTSTSGSISFAPKVDFTTDAFPNGIAIGDIDGDGKPDVVITNYYTNTVSVFRNTSSSGSISFAPKVDFTTGGTPNGIAIGDIDGDGKPDLVVVNHTSNTVSVLRNTSSPGSISFDAKVDFVTGATPCFVAIGDIDGDGKPDVIITNGLSNTVSVFRNTSSPGSITSGSLAAKVDFTTGANPLGVAIGDIDGDGRPDLVVGNFASNTISVLQNIISGPLSAPTLVAPGNGSTGVSTNPTLAWNASSGATSYRLQVSTVSTFATTVFDRSNIATTSQSVSGLSRSTAYYWRVNATGSTGTSGWSTTAGFTTYSYPSSIQVSAEFTFPGTLEQTDYRIIGLPGDVSVSISSLVSGDQRTNWNAYYDNGASNNYQVEYDGSSTFYFQPGNAFWILSKTAFSVSQIATTVSLDNSDCYSISLHSGWNLVSNPFEKSVAWSSVQSLNGASQPIWAFSGNYSVSASLVPYNGYYFYNDVGLSSLRIPYVYGSNTTGVAHVSSVAEETVTVGLIDGSAEESSITVGERSTSSAGSANVFAPPGDFQRARICIVDSNVTAGWKELVKDYRDTIGTGQKFDFYVKNKTGRNLKLKSYVGQVSSQHEIFLIDKDIHRSYDLKDSDQISIPSFDVLKSFSILVGDKSFVDAKLAELFPKGFLLCQNYPNPFNPVTVIRFEVPSAEDVHVVVYDALGRKVKTLMNANVSPGYYEIPFDGTTLASGIYFYRLSAGSFNQVKKMILLK